MNGSMTMIEAQTKTTERLAITIKNAPPRSMPVPDVVVDDSRDAYLTAFGKSTLKDRYLSPGESYQDRFANSVRYYADDQAHAQRMYDYVSKMWCIGATPITSNGGTTKGNLISCFLNEVSDSLTGIVDAWVENIWLGAKGGGTGTSYSKVRSIGEKAGANGKTSGMMSFVKVNDALSACISQGSVRRAAGAIFLDISHPEIEAFIDMRRESGGDANMKALNLHHGVVIPDAFYEACKSDAMWDLVDPSTKAVKETVSARALMHKLLTTRVDKGEPYIINIDHVNKAIPEHHKKSGLLVSMSNLCCEIVLPTGIDHHGVDRTAVCCLFQLNLKRFEEWKDNELFLEDVARFMDNVLQDFIDNSGDEFVKARYAAMRERSIGIGYMGFHTFLQTKNIPFESAMAKVWNMKMAKHIKQGLDKASIKLAHERGACPDAAEHGIMERFSNKIALAPTASVSIICETISPGGDAIPANVYMQKTLDGTFEVKNRELEALLEAKGYNTKEVWTSIESHMGSVAHLDFLSDHEKNVYKTSFEINPRWLLEHAADRTPYICQSQSLNLPIPPNVDKYDLLGIHMEAWERGIKSLYYLRSYSLQQVDNVDGTKRVITGFKPSDDQRYSECLACQ